MIRGIISSLIAGILYGIVVMLRGGMTLYGSLIDMPSPVFGWAIFLVYTALLGALFGLVFGRISQLLPLFIIGLIYGLCAGLLVTFVIFPIALNMSFHMSLGAIMSALPVFVGYTIYGGVMALCYRALQKS